ncbi:MAG: hypothetical protein OEZ19_08530 [Paracoccaceae bacterium]|nr:hypothetical protein [Paracoccaceae bacterium]
MFARVFLILALLAQPAFAHAPVFDLNKTAKTAEAPFIVEDPEHSKAIFSELTGAAHYYRIDAPEAFDFYVGMTAPKLDACGLQQTFSFDVLNADMKRIDGRDGSTFKWWEWYEEFGKNWYWVGPEIGKDFLSTTRYAAGTYYIRIFNKENTGKYVLAVGDDERFGPAEIFRAVTSMGKINRTFWNNADCS